MLQSSNFGNSIVNRGTFNEDLNSVDISDGMYSINGGSNIQHHPSDLIVGRIYAEFLQLPHFRTQVIIIDTNIYIRRYSSQIWTTWIKIG